MESSSPQSCRFQLPDLLCDELLPLQSLLPDLLLDGSFMRTDSKMVLNHFPGNAGDVGRLPCKHIDIRPQESDKRAFLFAVEGGAYGESLSRAILLDDHLLGLWWCSSGFLALAGGALWHVLDGNTTLLRGALAGVGARGLAGLLPSRGFSGRSKCLGGSRRNRFPVELIGADQRVFLVGGDGDDGHRPRHLQRVVGVMRRRHELG